VVSFDIAAASGKSLVHCKSSLSDVVQGDAICKKDKH